MKCTLKYAYVPSFCCFQWTFLLFRMSLIKESSGTQRLVRDRLRAKTQFYSSMRPIVYVRLSFFNFSLERTLKPDSHTSPSIQPQFILIVLVSIVYIHIWIEYRKHPNVQEYRSSSILA